MKRFKDIAEIEELHSTLNRVYITEEDVLLVDKSLFGDNNEHCYEMHCYDGTAIGEPVDKNGSEPMRITMTYPKLKEVLESDEKSSDVLVNRGLFDCTPADIHYGDIMMCYGKITGYLKAV